MIGRAVSEHLFGIEVNSDLHITSEEEKDCKLNKHDIFSQKLFKTEHRMKFSTKIPHHDEHPKIKVKLRYRQILKNSQSHR